MPHLRFGSRAIRVTMLVQRSLATIIAALVVGAYSAPGHTAGAHLESDTARPTAGYFQLSWSATEPARLMESRSADFRDEHVIYAGEDTARVMSGKPNGDWYYRLEATATGTPLTEAVIVRVRHHPLERAWSFFGIGAIVFAATAGLIGFGNRAANRRPDKL